MEGKARIYTFTVINSATGAFKDKTPYVVAVVENSGQKMVTRIEGYEQDIEVKIGMEVQFSYTDENSNPIYRFL